ncbi:alpha/beta fold hydrolase [Nonomuraea guangzhouensis]|uniref:Alpha/beta fold hydrolase n=1 Tax=Nonomuraea guangzhouensis TaxID=1291555 RepID=A0ABW4GR54_9ACTN|nr:alpha/beta fold hydrolase [Nonomuraea guangzhouensis]
MDFRALVVGIALATAALPAIPAFADPVHECATAVSRCDGTVSVPLNWNDPSSERITVSFAWLPAKAGAKGTILANPGGPLPALPQIPIIQQTLGPVLDRQNLLVVEPRGLGKSSPLLCPGLNLMAPDTITACARQLGPRAQYFTADQVVADMNAVRRALGVPEITFYGNSYGTLYAQAYATRYPESLSAAFLDSTTITAPDGYALWPMRSRLDRLDLVCERSRACRALPGDASGTWTRLVAHLRAEPDAELPIGSLIAVVRNVQQPVFGRESSAAATAYLRGDPAPLRRLARVVSGSPQQPVEGAEWAGYLAHRCGDGSFPFDRDATAAERERQIERYFREERPLAPFTPADMGVTGAAALEFCVNWPTPRDNPPVPPRATRPAVPVLVVGGDFDTQSPAEVARALRTFPNAKVVRVRYGGHSLAWGGGPVGECVRTGLRAFLSDPAHRVPDLRCDAENYRAAGAFPRSSADVTAIPATGLRESERRTVSAVFATAVDATSRRNPYALLHARLKTEPGLRGGRVDFHDDTITLDQTRFVTDLQADGDIRLSVTGQATAALRATGADGRAHDITLTWQAFTAQERPALSGTFDGRPFSSPGT